MFNFAMDSTDFRKRGKEMVDYIADYMETLGRRRVTPDVEPGYLTEKLPKKAPRKGEEFKTDRHDIVEILLKLALNTKSLNQI
jgi:aromatic-L-amino-acid decarboxylase